MSLTSAVCPQCNATLEIEASNDATLCPICNTPFITQKAVDLFKSMKKKARIMDVEQLKEYLEKVRSLENDIYTFDTIKEQLYQKAISIQPKSASDRLTIYESGNYKSGYDIELPRKVAISSREPEKVEEPVEPKNKNKADKIRKNAKISFIAFFCLLLPFASDKIYEIEFLAYTALCLAGVLFCATAILYLCAHLMEKNEESQIRLYEKAQREYVMYQIKLKNYQREVEHNKELYEEKVKEYEEKKAKAIVFNRALHEKITVIEESRAETEAALKKMYELNIVHRKYWGIIPISMFCEYIDTGRRTVLDGENGMYDLYEAELLGKQIVGELNVVNNNLRAIHATLENMSQKLSGIQCNQMLLYEAVMEGNTIAQNISREVGQQSRQLDKLSDSVEENLQQLRQSAELTAYNTAATARRTDALAKIAEYEFSLRHPSFPSV